MSSIPRELIARVPSLDAVLVEARRNWEATFGPDDAPDADHVFGSVVVPHICKLARRGLTPADTKLVRQLFDFVEELLADPRPSVRSIAEVSFAEQLGADFEAVRNLIPLMGPLLRRAVEVG